MKHPFTASCLHRSRSHSVAVRCVFLIVLGVSCRPAVADTAIAAEALTDEHLQTAITAIKEELYARKNPKQFWEPGSTPSGESTTQGGGYTALATLALVKAGESYQDPRLADAIEYLKTVEMEGTYAISVRAMLWAQLPPKFLPQLEKDALWLLNSFLPEEGSWKYTAPPSPTRPDNSLAQFGALALWETARRGGSIDERYWQSLENRYLRLQLENGGWNYRGDADARGSMTAAGLATLFITQDQLHAEEAVKPGATADTPHQRSIDQALAWMDRNFSATENPGADVHYFYYLYSMERAGLAGGYQRFAGRDWFRLCAAEIIDRLCDYDDSTGEITVRERMGGRGNNAIVRVRHLAFSLMFLTRGRVPIAINKLTSEDAALNNRPRDAANLTDWIHSNIEHELNWQRVSIDSQPENWLDAPLLYIASNERLPWFEWNRDTRNALREAKKWYENQKENDSIEQSSPPSVALSPQLQKLKRYVDLGGMILAAQEGRGTDFAESIERAGSMMYPQYEWRRLKPDHFAYTMLWPVHGRKPRLQALSNGVRELIIIARGGDFSEAFQLRDKRRQSTFETVANLWVYASEQDRAKPRLAQHYLKPDNTTAGSERITIVHAAHHGNANAEATALEVFSTAMAKQRNLNISIERKQLHEINELTPLPDLVVINGINEINFGEKQLQAIKNYLQAEGVILFETVGGRGEFAKSAETAMGELFRADAQPLIRHQVITAEGVAAARNLPKVTYRPYAIREVFAGNETRPRIRGMKVDGDVRVFFSREDISNGLLDQHVWGVSGYTAQSARDLLGNLAQYAAEK